MKKRLVLYLGGYYMAEKSLAQSFIDGGCEVVFAMSAKFYGQYLATRPSRGAHAPIHVCDNITATCLHLRPDAIIHRYYVNDPQDFPDSAEVAERLGIPFIRYQAEVDWNTVLQPTPCDLFLYGAVKLEDGDKYLGGKSIASMGRAAFYPYGVSSFERVLPIERKRNIGAFGLWRDYPQRNASARFYIRAAKSLGEKIHTYGWGRESLYKLRLSMLHVQRNPAFTMEEQTEVMNRHALCVNIQSIDNDPQILSHKVFQSLGCGVPTISKFNPVMADLLTVESGIILVDTIEETRDWMRDLIKNPLLRDKLSKMGEKHMHRHFDWWKRFNKIMRASGLW